MVRDYIGMSSAQEKALLLIQKEIYDEEQFLSRVLTKDEIAVADEFLAIIGKLLHKRLVEI